MNRIIGIDPGATCGMVVLDEGRITFVFNIMSEQLCNKLTPFLIHTNCTVVLEDIRPYSLRLTPQVVDTCKFIGEVCYRLRIEAGSNLELMVRSEVKKWCFDSYPDVCLPIIEKKILKKGYTKKIPGDRAGEDITVPRKPSFVFVDDKVVTECMKVKYSIEKPKSGYGYQFGLKDHSWQALAIAACFEEKGKIQT